jgi:hypothetical protein
MNRLLAVLAGVVVVETGFLVFVLAEFNQRIDRMENAVRATALHPSNASDGRHDGWVSVRF